MPIRLRSSFRPYDPFHDLNGLHEEINRLRRDSGWRLGGRQPHGTSEFPPVNLWEGEHDVLLMAEIPGVAADALEITIRDGALTLKGKVSSDPEATGAAWHRRERHYGVFGRTVMLPFDVEQDKVQADFANGVLRVYLPRPENRKPKRIKISQG